MKYATRVSNEAELFGAQETGDFTILANGKAFSVLIDGLYADKIWSIVREACANAFDGHTKGDNLARPFLVHAPTRWEPHFYVRDFGCSMTHEFVMRLYTQLFFSTKDQSNEESGCFGLGSKAPFSYTTTFTVSCFLDGEARHYTAYIDADDMPRIVLNQREPTTEENGVMVQMAVDSNDFFAFKRAIQKAVLGYDTPFICEGVELPALTYHQRHGSYDVVAAGLPDTGPLARIGPVLYPLSKSNESALMAFGTKNKKIASLLSFGDDIVINLPISGGQVTPSREALSYSPKMIATLADHLDAICQTADSKLTKIFAACTSKWEYAVALLEAQADTALSRFECDLLNNFETPFGCVSSLLGVTIPSAALEPGSVKPFYDGMFRRRDAATMRRTVRNAVVTHDIDGPRVLNISGRLRGLVARDDISCVYVVCTFDPDVQFALRKQGLPKDLDRAARKRRLDGVYKRMHEARKRLDALVVEFECPRVYEAAKLARPPAETRRQKPPIVYSCKGMNSWQAESLDRHDDDKPTLVYPLHKRQVIDGKHFPNTRTMVNHFKAAGLPYERVLGVGDSRVAALKKLRPHWHFAGEVVAKGLGNLDQLLKIGDTLQFLAWIDGNYALAERHKALAGALKLCPPDVGRVFENYLGLHDMLMAQRDTARAEIVALVAAGTIPDRRHFDGDSAKAILTLLQSPRLFDNPHEHRLDGVEREWEGQYPEFNGSIGNDAIALASYLTGRPLLFLPAAESMQQAA